nr:immunoglobulin heavy chain junction region [Mus musculus]NSM07629.1 immunoglobulin heavy chain junction region [Mus musculus]
CAKGNWDPDYW